jgi:hypothetical protein
MKTSLRMSTWLALLIAAALRWPLWLRPIQDLDEPNFASIAALCNAGGALYRDGGVDNKPPGIFWAYRLVLGADGHFAMARVHLLCVAVSVITAYLLGLVGRRLGGARVGFYTMLLYAIFSMAYDPRMIAANTEQFMMLPLAAAMWLLVRDDRLVMPRLAGAGALVAVACLFKQVAVVSLGVVLLAAMGPLRTFSTRGRRALRSALCGVLACTIGFSAVMTIVVAVLVAQGTILDAIHWTVVSLFSHYGPSAWSGSILRHLEDAALSSAIFTATALPLCVAALGELRRPGAGSDGERLVFAWLPLSALGVVAGGHFSDHYFIQLVGPLALLGGLHIGRRPTANWNAALAFFGFGVMVFAALIDPITYQPFWRHPSPDYRVLVRAIDARTQPDDRIFVWGNAPALYVLSDRLPATRFVGFLRGLHRSEHESPTAAWDAGPEVWPLLAADFARHPPELVVDTSTGDYREFGGYPMARFPVLQSLVARDYVFEGQVERATLYRRRR